MTCVRLCACFFTAPLPGHSRGAPPEAAGGGGGDDSDGVRGTQTAEVAVPGGRLPGGSDQPAGPPGPPLREPGLRRGNDVTTVQCQLPVDALVVFSLSSSAVLTATPWCACVPFSVPRRVLRRSPCPGRRQCRSGSSRRGAGRRPARRPRRTSGAVRRVPGRRAGRHQEPRHYSAAAACRKCITLFSMFVCA